MTETIAKRVQRLEEAYVHQPVKQSDYVDFSMHETIQRVDAYCSGKHISGSKDALGRDKPFFDIVTSALITRDRATDLDTKNIRILPKKAQQTLLAYFADVLLKDWMRREQFGKFLNKWGYVLAKYDTALIKFTEKNKRLVPEVVPWSSLIVDPLDITKAPIIEKLYLTEAELKQSGYDKQKVKQLLEAEVTRKTLGGQQVDNQSEYIEVYEVHGEMELSFITGKEEDKDIFVQQMQVVSFYIDENKEMQEFVLYAGKEEKSPYLLTHLTNNADRTLGRGVVEQLFDSQWMINHFMKASKDALDFSSKVGFQTSDPTFIGQNALDSFETGDILVTKDGKGLTQLNTQSYADGSLITSKREWEQNAIKTSGTTEAMMGEAKAGAAWRQTEALLKESHSLFEKMIENKGLAIEEMLRVFIIPFLKKGLDTKDEITVLLEAEYIEKIDSIFLPRKAVKIHNDKAINQILETGETTSTVEEATAELKSGLSEMGNMRSFKPDDIGEKTWKSVLKDFEWDCIVEVTGESVDLQSNIATLATVLQTLASNPTLMQNPDTRMIINAIITSTGTLSPLQLSNTQQPVQPQTAQNTQQLQDITPVST